MSINNTPHTTKTFPMQPNIKTDFSDENWLKKVVTRKLTAPFFRDFRVQLCAYGVVERSWKRGLVGDPSPPPPLPPSKKNIHMQHLRNIMETACSPNLANDSYLTPLLSWPKPESHSLLEMYSYSIQELICSCCSVRKRHVLTRNSLGGHLTTHQKIWMERAFPVIRNGTQLSPIWMLPNDSITLKNHQ